MPEIKLLLTLEREARKSGGDRYFTIYKDDEVSLYFPQSITRTAGVPTKHITMTLEVGKEDLEEK